MSTPNWARCAVCGAPCGPEESPFAKPLCEEHRALPCWACGKSYAQHADRLPYSGARPRMPCSGLKSGFWPELAPPPTLSAAATCERCEVYRSALRAIVTGADNGLHAMSLGDLARVALIGDES